MSESAASEQRPRRSPRGSRGRRGTPPRGPAVAALIVAHDQARRIAATVRAALAIPGVDLVLVVDDGSTDNTQDLARNAGAVVVRHPHIRGRSAAVETGASVIAMRDEPGATPRAILMLDGNLGHHAIGAAPLVPAVLEGVCDLAVALTEAQEIAQGMPSGIARTAVERATGWSPRQPLGRIRCVTREALEVAMPLARGAGLEAAMTLDVLQAGLTITEVECEIRHKGHAADERTMLARANRYREVLTAVSSRRLRSTASSTRASVDRRLHPARGEAATAKEDR
ncbi:glycosyltransferase family 2 protein [Demequina lignilytica]|uniref:Glucosyl-3-phosphoglycerate synthase n=1 Tax=Demequina lignilytica TaxID=3051663 RepID=A0AAW7M893_9MICO|nr:MULTISPECIES: glycosyltransferase [unclassified Demequina]MDN4477701.1 glycosyltransferase [Demequina sp. SYSU T00039-1]MDN4483336.1 glycosyltransferase [Demequina sp. SYSU T0a273]MDN4487610.1 glycosyltransferase [Demequina sp. SYSU T00039]MDN4491321.1 glycosyltransferase [Demequina sp. SYSU T00068]